MLTYDAASATDDSGLVPTISYSQASGTLFAAGVTTVTITATDAAGNAATSTFTVTVNLVNHMPSFTKGVDRYIYLGLEYPVNEVVSQSNWATGIDDGDSPVTQSLTFNVTNDNNALFTTPPAVSSTGTLTFTPNGNLGIVTVFVTLTDDNTINGTAALTTAAQAFTITFTDNGGSPVVTVLGGTTAFTEGADAASTPVVVAGTITVTDQDSTRFASATVSIAANFQSGQDVLAFTNDGSTMGDITGSYDPVMGVLELTSPFPHATIAQWQQALRAVTYMNSSDTPGTSTRTVRFVVRDSSLSPGAGTRSLSVTAANDSPVATVPASIAMTVDAAGALTGISFGDVDAGSGTVGAVFTVGSGTLSATSGSGVTVSGSGTGSLTLAGTITSLNAFIAASRVTFITALNATGNVTLTSAISDNGNTGSGGAKSDSDTTTLTMTVNTVRTWLGGGSAWDDNARWSPGQPVSGNSIVFDASGTGGPSAGTQTSSLEAIRLTGDYDGSVVMQAASTTASSLELSATGAAVLDLNGKTLTITGDVVWSSATASIALGGGNLVLLGNLTTSGGGVVNITGAGTVTYSTGVSRTLTLVNAGNAVAGTLVKQGAAPLVLAGSGAALNLGGLSILAGMLDMNGKTLNVAGAPVISGGSLYNAPGSVLNCGGIVGDGGDYQPGGGTLNFNTTGTWSDSTGFEDFGTVNLTAGANVTLAGDVRCSALNVQGGTASAVVLAGRTLNVTGNVTWSSAATAAITGGSGRLDIGGNLTATGAGVIQMNQTGSNAVRFNTAGAKVITLANPGNIIAGALVIGTGITATSVSFTGSASDLALGSLTINGSATLSNAAAKQISITSGMTQSGTYNAGAGSLLFTGTGSLTDNVGTNLGAVTKSMSGTLTLAGSATTLFSSLTITAGNVTNSSAHVATVTGAASITGSLSNTGGATFTTSGTFTVNAGALVTNSAATMNFGGNVTFNAGSSYTGTGSANFTGTTTLRDDAGVSLGSAVTVSGSLTLSAASTQPVTFNALTLNSGATLNTNGKTLQINSTPVINGDLINSQSAGLVITRGISVNAGGSYTSGGTLRFSGSGGAWTGNGGASFGRVELAAGFRATLTTNINCSMLLLGGIQQPAGTHGSTVSAAANTSDAYFSGTGLTTVANGPTPLVAWAQSFGLTDVTPIGDPDLDGIPNLLEFAFGMQPASARRGSLTYSVNVITTGEPVASVTNAIFVRRKDYLTAGLTYTVEFSPDLTTWTPASTTPDVLADDGIHQVVSVPMPTGQTRHFFRIVVSGGT
ncbi:MAG: beta strand repeat-containing protein [Prosthecobacter sp.]|uniref:beta strand repeat-containing protein n=1 Tax=Prosthecobacter sp. TaxID=1965333 RepID=UPI0038FD5CC8